MRHKAVRGYGRSNQCIACVQATAASVLLRGLLFAAVRQAPRRWLPLRKSAWGTAQQGIAANLAQLLRLVWARTGSSYASDTCPGSACPLTGVSLASVQKCLLQHIPALSCGFFDLLR